MTNKRIIALVGVVLMMIAGFSVFVSAQETDGTATTQSTTSNQRYEIAGRTQIREDDLVLAISGVGVLEPERRVRLQFQTAAPVVEILVEEGQTVEAGEILARVDNSALMERLNNAQLQLALENVNFDTLLNPATAEDIAVAEAAIEAARLNMGVGVPLTGEGSIGAEIDEINADLQANILWQSQLNRDNNPPNLDAAWMAIRFTEPDTPERAEAVENYNLLEAQIRIQEQNLRNLESEVVVAQEVAVAEQERPTTTGGSSSAQQQLIQAQINLENLIGDPDTVDFSRAQIDLSLAELDVRFVEALLQDTLLVAPFNGVIGEINLAIGEVPPADAIQLIDNSAFELTIPVDELDVVHVQAGQPVELSLEALPDAALTGSVYRVAFTPTERSGITTYDVRIKLDETEALIRTGMTATVRIITESISDVVLAPAQYVQQASNSDADFVVIEQPTGTLEIRPVEVGRRTTTAVQIIDGATNGETIVILSEEELQRLIQDQIQSGNAMVEEFFNGR